jgi:hypothetical protein
VAAALIDSAESLLVAQSVIDARQPAVPGVSHGSAATNREIVAPGPPPDHAQGRLGAPATSIDGVQLQFGPVHTTFLTANLQRLPTKDEQTAFAGALDTIESVYEFSPAGVFVFVSYGMGYFGRLPGALNGGSLAATHIPRLNFDNNRFALEEAKPSPTDAGQPGIVKRKFDITPQLGGTDVLFTIRSDSAAIIKDVVKWIKGNSTTLGGQAIPAPQLPLKWTSTRVMFSQRGLPRQVAENDALYYADRINDQSPMWMGFADQQTSSTGPAPAVTFAGNASSRLTTAVPGDYFDNGSIQHLSHVILDLEAFYAGGRGRLGRGRDLPGAARAVHVPLQPAALVRRRRRPVPQRRRSSLPPQQVPGDRRRRAGRAGRQHARQRPPHRPPRRAPAVVARPTARPCTSAWTGPASTPSTCRT